jgi:hypothetical protein
MTRIRTAKSPADDGHHCPVPRESMFTLGLAKLYRRAAGYDIKILTGGNPAELRTTAAG